MLLSLITPLLSPFTMNYSPYTKNVFVNCPFDDEYKPVFKAIVFTVLSCGLGVRCALEVDDGSEVRIEKIIRITKECRFGIHDISRTELDKVNALPRFNMPLSRVYFWEQKNSERRYSDKRPASFWIQRDTDIRNSFPTLQDRIYGPMPTIPKMSLGL